MGVGTVAPSGAEGLISIHARCHGSAKGILVQRFASALMVALVVVAGACIPQANRVRASGQLDAPPGKMQCKTITRRVHGRKKTVRECVASQPPSAPLVRPVSVSGSDSLAACTAGSYGPDLTSRNFSNSAVEPSVAVNPKAQANIIGVWQQDRWSDAGARGLVAGYTSNGGKTWAESPLPLGSCVPGGLKYDRASDPSISIGPDGTAYATGIVVTFLQHGTAAQSSQQSSAVAVTTSRDGGKTWVNSQTIHSETNSLALDDKPWVTADPAKPGVAYVVWDAPDPASRTANALFSRTADGGRTWSSPQIMVPAAPSKEIVNNEILVDPRTDMLYEFFQAVPWVSTGGTHAYTIASATSSDDGSHWSAPRTVAADIPYVDVRVPPSSQPVRADFLAQPAIDPRSGKLYVVCEELNPAGSADAIALTASNDSGERWSAPSPITTETPSGTLAFLPSLAVNSAGDVGTSYYDIQSGTAAQGGIPTDYWLIVSSDGGASFGRKIHLDSFDLNAAPQVDQGYFLGDYEGLTAEGAAFIPFWSRSSGGETDIRTAAVTAPPGARRGSS